LKNLKKILFTFDYELFLGSKSGSVKNCLIEPTNELIKIFDRHKIRNAIFFVDTSYLMKLKNEKDKNCLKDFNSISNQLITLIDKGHYVFPHIHPHWLDAIYLPEINQWSLSNFSKYRFHSASLNEKEKLFSESFQILNDILSKGNKPFIINGYRAGGWSIQPFSDFEPFFDQHRIKNEFSVVPGFKNLSEAQYFDFTNSSIKQFYKFDNDPCVESKTGKYTEFTISSLFISTRMYWLGKLFGKYLWKTGQHSMGDGLGLVIKDPTTKKYKKEFLGSKNREMISIELLTKVKIPLYKKFLKTNDYMHFISHPKMLSMHNIKSFDSFLNFSTSKFDLKTDFSDF
jgi:hypothetical protein